jgi:hypothetical protein
MFPNVIQITVTQNDIDQGERLDVRACPIARAVRRKFGETREIEVADVLSIDNIHYELSPRARQFIRDFDEYGAGGPVRFRFRKAGLPT